MQVENPQLEGQVASAVRAVISTDDSAHSIEHVNEVWRLAKWLLSTSPASYRIVLAAAYCHDLKSRGEAGFDKAIDSSVHHSSPLLRGLGYSDPEIRSVGECIVEGSWEYFVQGRVPTTPEATILRDADWLEAMGAHGVARVFAYSGRCCLPMTFVNLDPEHPVRLPTPEKGPNPPFEHFYSKLLWLKDNLITPEARVEGEHRHTYMVNFLKEYGQEIARTTSPE